VKIVVFSGGLFFSQEREYFMDMVVVPRFTAVNVHTSLPGAPARLDSDETYVDPENFTTDSSILLANCHEKPVDGLEWRVMVKLSPGKTEIVFAGSEMSIVPVVLSCRQLQARTGPNPSRRLSEMTVKKESFMTIASEWSINDEIDRWEKR
jgi:hypothetical protein